MRLLVTGAGGFVGSRAVRLALERGHVVLGVGRMPAMPLRLAPFSSQSGFAYQPVDVTSHDALRACATAFSPDVLVHAAVVGILRRDPAGPHEALRMNVLGAAEVARAALEIAAPVVWIGSSFEYAPSDAPIDEAYPTEPESLYGVAKNLGWRAFRHLCGERVRYVALRPFQVYGPGEDSARFTISALLAPSGRAPNAFGDPTLVRDFVYVDDVALGIVAAADVLMRGEALFRRVLNLATGTGATLGAVAKLAAQASGASDFRHDFRGRSPVGGYDPAYLVGDARAAGDVLGWRAQTTLADGLSRTFESL